MSCENNAIKDNSYYIDESQFSMNNNSNLWIINYGNCVYDSIKIEFTEYNLKSENELVKLHILKIDDSTKEVSYTYKNKTICLRTTQMVPHIFTNSFVSWYNDTAFSIRTLSGCGASVGYIYTITDNPNIYEDSTIIVRPFK